MRHNRSVVVATVIGSLVATVAWRPQVFWDLQYNAACKAKKTGHLRVAAAACRLAVDSAAWIDDDSLQAMSLGLFGDLRWQTGAVADAEAAYLAALGLWQQGPWSPGRRIQAEIAQMQLASFYAAQGEFENALLHFETLEQGPSFLGRSPWLRMRLAKVYQSIGDPSKADTTSRRVLEEFIATHGSAHPVLGKLCVQRAAILEAQGRTGEAESLYVEGIRLMQGGWGMETPEALPGLDGYAALLLRTNRDHEAEILSQQAREIRGSCVQPPPGPATVSRSFNTP